MEEVINDLEILFQEAKDINEFDFVLTLLNYRGMGTHKLMTNLYEWFDAIEFYKSLYLELTGKEKTRIGALIYSTFFENSDFYNIIGSLCNVKLGFKPSSYLYWKTKKYERLLGIGEKQEALLELLHDADKKNIINFFNENHYKEIRNTFFHSAYALSDTDYILHDSEPIIIENLGISSFNVEEFFYPRIEKILVFFTTFKKLYIDSFSSYKEDKEVIGCFPMPTRITIMGGVDGLQGFRIKNSVQIYGEWHDSGIWYNELYDMYEGHNIRFNIPNIETVEVGEQLTRYENKDDIHQSDVEFHNLVEKISDRKRPVEIERATKLLLKFGDLRHQKMEKETNAFKKRSYPKYIIPFYKKAIQIGSGLLDMKSIQGKLDKFTE
ncbi:hypothetical protein [uncultured Tenacibaculum sp.]|uniref:hypothetical protein n=1 Tax=uncultured Tenacibaculum sp. TaxID=174713 RepID=UPI00261EFF20|nr:hypothetical protein [uncultured Tenacibaculum sp.]